jgi:uncharacterized protein YndB with AHSA1/START domain
METAERVKTESFVIRRIIDAPIERVWRAWTEPELLRRWWGPQYYTSPSCELDLRVGGRLLLCMRAPAEQGGQDSYTTGRFTRIVPKELLEFTQSPADKDGAPLDPAAAGLPADFPEETLTTVSFERKGELTKLRLTVSGMSPGQLFVFAFAGWHQSLDKFEDSL